MPLLLLKVTLIFAAVLASMPLMRRTSSALRHLVCLCGIVAVVLLPVTLLVPATIAPIRISAFTFVASATAQPPTGVLPLRVVWAVGTALLLLRIAIGYLRLAWLLRTSAPGDGFVFSDVSVPLVAGLFRPLILMPRAAESWPLAQQAAAIRHERAHIDRKDLWTSLLAHLACAVYWFHPLAWAVAQRLREEQETACDDAVLSSGFEPALYAEALIATACRTTSTQLIGCHMLTHKTLKSRIARLFESGMPRMSSTSTLRLAGIGFMAVSAVIGLLNGAGPADDPIKIGEGVSAPRVLYKVDPVYTEEARAAKIDGAVVLSVIVGTDGLAHDINVVSGIDPGLDHNAVDAVAHWRFQPATKDGAPVAVKANIEVNFKLL